MKRKRTKKQAPRISLAPLTPEEALRIALNTPRLYKHQSTTKRRRKNEHSES